MLPAASPRRLFLLGGVAILFGIIAAAWPISTVITLAVIWGCFALVDGIVLIYEAVRGRRESRAFSIVIGAIGVLAGLIAVIHPFSGAAALTWVIGLWLVARGIAQIVEAFGHEFAGSKWLTVLAGLAWLVGGILVMTHTGVAALTISVWLGFLAIMWGVLLIGAGFAVRSKTRGSTGA